MVVTGATTSLQAMRCDSEDGRGGEGAHSESGSRAFSHYISSSPTTSLHQTSASRLFSLPNEDKRTPSSRTTPISMKYLNETSKRTSVFKQGF